MLHLLLVLFLASPPPEPEYFRLDFSPSGSQIAIGQPVVKGGMLVFHAYPDGKLMSLRRSDVKGSTKITAKEAAAPAATNPRPIANLAMQGGTATVVGVAGVSGQPAGAGGSSGPALTRPIQQGMAAAQAASVATVPQSPN